MTSREELIIEPKKRSKYDLAHQVFKVDSDGSQKAVAWLDAAYTTPGTVLLSVIRVEKEFRRLGIGYLLIDLLIKLSLTNFNAQRIIGSISPDNDVTREEVELFYRKMGFSINGNALLLNLSPPKNLIAE